MRATLRSPLFLLFIVSLALRLVGALWLPNAFGDAYAYTEQIYYLRRALTNGTFSVSNLFGFWLPLYQFVCAGISAITGSPFYVPKLVSAAAGAGACLLVALITFDLTRSKYLSLGAGWILALNPYHIFYSSSAMTDVPHGFLILLCAYCCIRDRWLLASLCALAAGLIRIESWTLIPMIPLASLLGRQESAANSTGPFSYWRPFGARRLVISAVAGLVLISGPLFWLYVSWKATGSFFNYFQIRNNYIVETLNTNPWLASFSPPRVGFDLLRLTYTSNPVLLAGAVALVLIVLNGKEGSPRARAALSTKALIALRKLLATDSAVLLALFFSHLAFLLLAYVTNNQPEIWPRYGLIFFTLGLPLLASLANITGFSWARDYHYRIFSALTLKPGAIIYTIAGLFSIQFCAQLVDVTRMTVKPDPNLIAAEYLGDQRRVDQSTRIYCEDGAIRVLSGIPLEEFRDQYNSSATNDEVFLKRLRDNQVRFLVYKDLPGSRLKELITRIRAGTQNKGITLEEINPKPRQKVKDVVVVYRIHDSEVAKAETKSAAVRRRHQGRQ